MSDPVNHPSHYNKGKIEVIEFLEDQKLDPHSFNVVKYVCRAGKKDPAKEVEDLEKAAWYLARRIELAIAAREGRAPCRPNEMKTPTRPTQQTLPLKVDSLVRPDLDLAEPIRRPIGQW